MAGKKQSSVPQKKTLIIGPRNACAEVVRELYQWISRQRKSIAMWEIHANKHYEKPEILYHLKDTSSSGNNSILNELRQNLIMIS